MNGHGHIRGGSRHGSTSILAIPDCCAREAARHGSNGSALAGTYAVVIVADDTTDDGSCHSADGGAAIPLSSFRARCTANAHGSYGRR